MNHLFYAHDGTPASASNSELSMPEGGYEVGLWKPSDGGLAPPGLSSIPFVVWWLFHRLGVFANGGYSVLMITRGGRIAHRSCVFPGWFRFPFMASDDLQIGDTWTDPNERGRGLASMAIRQIVSRCGRPGRRIWYVCEETNTASQRAAEKAGFVRVGEGARTRRFGLGFLGAFVLQRAVPPLVVAPARPAP